MHARISRSACRIQIYGNFEYQFLDQICQWVTSCKINLKEKMTALKYLMPCLFALKFTISSGNNASLPPRHISEFSDPISSFNPFIDIEEGYVNDSRASSFSDTNRSDSKLIENGRINLLSATSMTESEKQMPNSFNETEQLKFQNVKDYDSNNKTVAVIKKLIGKNSQQAKIPSERHLRIHDSIINEESIINKLIPEESQKAKMPKGKHLRVYDSINNEGSINKLIPEESQKTHLTTVNIDSEPTASITKNKDIIENENNDLEIQSYTLKWKKNGITYSVLRNGKTIKQKNSDIENHFPSTINSYEYTIYAIACGVFVIILYVVLSLKRSLPINLD